MTRPRSPVSGPHRWLRSAASAFDVPPGDDGPLGAAIRASLWARVILSSGGLVAAGFLPGTFHARVWFALLVAAVAMPYAIVVMVATRRGVMRGASLLTFVGDTLVTFMFQAAIPAVRATIFMVYLVLVCFYTVVAGIRFGLGAGMFGVAAAIALHRVDPTPIHGSSPFAYVSFVAAVIAMAIIVSAATEHERERMRRRISTVSHELRGPLTSIEGFAATLSERWEHMEDRQRIEYVGRIRRNAASVHSIIATFLDVADVRMGTLQPAIATVPLRDFVEGLCRLCAPMFLGRPLRLKVPNGIYVAADPALLERILVNLVMNAHGYSPPGEEIVLEAGDRNGQVVISVTDRGPGIPGPMREQIFKAFWRPKGQDRRGSGIGLALARELTVAMGGRIWVEGAPEGGSRFSVALPSAGTADSGKQTG